VGEPTADGVITEADAEVMRKIWERPRRATGEPLWFGLRPGAESRGDNVYQHGRCLTARVGGELVPVPFGIAESWFRWVAGDPGLGLPAMTFERFEELFDQGVLKFAEVTTDSPDLSGLRGSGMKCLVTCLPSSASSWYPV